MLRGIKTMLVMTALMSGTAAIAAPKGGAGGPPPGGQQGGPPPGGQQGGPPPGGQQGGQQSGQNGPPMGGTNNQGGQGTPTTQPSGVHGKIVSASGYTISVKDRMGKAAKIVVDNKTTFTLDGQSATSAAVQPGLFADSMQTTGTATSVELHTRPPQPPAQGDNAGNAGNAGGGNGGGNANGGPGGPPPRQ